jgi:hypothetical protein
MTRRLLLLGAAVVAVGTAAPSAARPAPESITYETGPCFGSCPIYKVTVRSDGTGIFEGINFTAVRGIRNFRMTPRQYRAFAAYLSPIRPERGSIDYSGERCRTMVTDMSSATVTWEGRGGTWRLHVYYGCDPDRHRSLIFQLSAAPVLLPIRDFIGTGR